jgi:transcriptional regulator of aroF, aroG, tyrA and aromatic amino acid transport
MKSKLKIQLIFEDRLGIVADVAARIAQQKLNIASMEVQKVKEHAYVYAEMEKRGGLDAVMDALFTSLRGIAGCLELKRIYTLPQEKREEGYKVVLDSISDGIVSIDENGMVTTINRVARKILNCPDDTAIGKPLRDLDLPDTCLLEAFQRQTYRSDKRNIITEKGRFQYFAACKPIKDTAGRVVGTVEIMKDMKEIEALAHAVSQPLRITFSDIVGTSDNITQVIGLAQKIARTDSIVSLRGESGTGKEIFAQAIHSESGRKGPFVPINCAALPESLLESELFGYEGGAFTGARRQGKPGLFETARNGTVFLDEIAEMSPKVQAKMLRLIQEKMVRRIGCGTEIPVNARIITATNRNLERLVEEKLFREDLYYRINVLPIHLPPLRRRLEDIPVLTDHFLFQLGARLGKKPPTLDPSALTKLNAHNWPGNIRELKNVIERAAILSSSDRLGQECILFSFELDRNMSNLRRFIHPGTGGQALRKLIDRYEKELITEALDQSSSIRQTAASLKVSHTTLLNKIKKYGIETAAGHSQR